MQPSIIFDFIGQPCIILWCAVKLLLPRTLMEANDNGSLSQGLTVAAMLSAETSLLKRKHTPLNFPDGGGLGDHIQLLQMYEMWDSTNFDIEWCREHGLQLQEMTFVKDIRG
ncbi:hypothetical protein RND81_07G201500 [Saponaria officinalis]|uniref:Uncharacterized protein n=1 Tax=Saponaria officinalis TaxID=3572 RepID=A0AAW1JTY9_SAPOF